MEAKNLAHLLSLTGQESASLRTVKYYMKPRGYLLIYLFCWMSSVCTGYLSSGPPVFALGGCPYEFFECQLCILAFS